VELAAVTPLRPAAVLHARLSDGELLVAIGAGDEESFEELYRRYARAIFSLALDRFRDHGRSEDAVQDVFALLWRVAANYRPEIGPGAPWLYTVARNAIATSQRKRRDLPAEIADTPSLDAGPDERAETAWQSFRVHRAVETLPAHQRQVVELGYWDHLSQSEIAERLGIPIGTVKTRTRAALKRLSETLREEMR
jgi:RNA polymerase sigma-70 factor (ECF subfamily)